MNNENFSETPTKKRFFPNLKEAWILALCVVPLMFVAYAIGELLKTAKIDNGIITLIVYLVSIGTLVFVAMRYKKSTGDSPQIYCKNKVSFLIYLLAIPAIIGLSCFVDVIGSIILPEISEDLQDELTKMMNFNLPVLLTTIVAAPVLEEIFCRGIICEGLIKNNSPREAILWSALIFAVIHLNPWQGISAFAIGCFLGWIYWKTRSILPCIFIHFVNNSAAVLIYNYHTKAGYDINASISDIYGINEIVFTAICFAVFAASFFFIAQKLKKVESL